MVLGREAKAEEACHRQPEKLSLVLVCQLSKLHQPMHWDAATAEPQVAARS